MCLKVTLKTKSVEKANIWMQEKYTGHQEPRLSEESKPDPMNSLGR